MENLKIKKHQINWDRTKQKHQNNIVYKNQILRHKDHISISKEMYVNGVLERQDLTHIPIELIDKLKGIEQLP